MRFNAKQFCLSLCCCTAVFAAQLGTATAGTIDYTPSIDFIPTATFSTTEDGKTLPGQGLQSQNGDVKFNFVFTQPLAKNINFSFEQDRSSGYNVTLGSAIQGGQVVCPGAINDIVTEFRVGYSTENIGLTLGKIIAGACAVPLPHKTGATHRRYGVRAIWNSASSRIRSRRSTERPLN